MALDKVLKIYDENGNPVDYDILASDVKFNDGKDLPTKLDEMEDEIGEGGYTPPQGGIPKTDLAQSVQDTLDDVADKVDKETGKGLSTNDYTTEEKNKLAGLPTNPVQSISVNGGTAQTPTNGNVNIQVQGGGQVTVTTNNDGTFTIHSGDNDYTINLNHTHEKMCKLEIVDEEPSDPALDTIYALVDDAEQPNEIQSLWIAGLEFVGGGGSEDDGLPKMSTPKDGNTISMGTYSGSAMTKEITVKAKNLNYGGSTTGLTVEAVGTGLTLTYGQTTGTSVTIPQTDAMIGAQLTINYSGTGALSDGELRFKQGSSVLAVVVVVVVVEIPSELVQDTAWCAASGENFYAPETQAGYCTTPFYQLTHDGSGNLDFIIKAGYVTPTDLARGMFVCKKALTDATTRSAFLQSSDPRRRQSSDDLGNTNYLSATIKTSEWADCYIYDYIAGAYLFAGANVDTSTPPQ